MLVAVFFCDHRAGIDAIFKKAYKIESKKIS